MLSTVEPCEHPFDPVERFDDLFRRLYSPLYGLAYRVVGNAEESEDLLQEAFVKLSDSSVLWRPDEEVAAWLRRVCLNLGFNRLRERRRSQARLERVGRLAPPFSDGDGGPAGAVLRREQQAAVRRALAHLPDRQRDCLLLRHSGYSYAEIAATLNLATGSVGVLLHRAERAFRAYYPEHEDDLP